MSDNQAQFIEITTGQWGPKAVRFTLQDGPIQKVGVNGCQIDDVIEFAFSFISDVNQKFPCHENSIALNKLEDALMWLDRRKRDRKRRRVEGFDKE